VATPWRVVVLTASPQVAQGYGEIVRACGHETVAVIVPRRSAANAQSHVVDGPAGADVCFPETKASLSRLLRAYGADLGLCTGFPWLVPPDALEAPRLGIVNGHPSLLPRYRGPFPIAWAVRNGESEIGMSYHLMDDAFDTGNLLAQKRVPLADDETEATLIPKLAAAAGELLPVVFDRLARGDRGDSQEGGDYQPASALDDYVHVDLTRPAADVHRQVRAWSFVPPVSPARGPIHDGRRLLVTSLTSVPGAERLECADGPLWVVASEPVQPTQ